MSSSDDKNYSWAGVQILVVDETSFVRASEMDNLNKNVQLIGESNKPFGGCSIIFSGDFHLLEPVGAKENEFLFSCESGCSWEIKLNAVIF